KTEASRTAATPSPASPLWPRAHPCAASARPCTPHRDPALRVGLTLRDHWEPHRPPQPRVRWIKWLPVRCAITVGHPLTTREWFLGSCDSFRCSRARHPNNDLPAIWGPWPIFYRAVHRVHTLFHSLNPGASTVQHRIVSCAVIRYRQRNGGVPIVEFHFHLNVVTGMFTCIR